MDNKLKRLVKEIKFRKDWYTKDVAESIGYTREHLTKEMGKGDNKDLINLLLQKHAEILQDVISDFLGDADSDGVDIKTQGLTMQALVNLTESNRQLAEAQNTMCRSHEELVMMVKKQNATTAGADSHTPLEIHGVVLAMREFLAQIAAKVNKTTVGEQDDFLDKMTMVAMESLAQKDTAAAGGKQGKG